MSHRPYCRECSAYRAAGEPHRNGCSKVPDAPAVELLTAIFGEPQP